MISLPLPDRLRDALDWLYAWRFFMLGCVTYAVPVLGPQLVAYAVGQSSPWVIYVLLSIMAFWLFGRVRYRRLYYTPRYCFFKNRRDALIKPHELANNERYISVGLIGVFHTTVEEHIMAKLKCPDLVSHSEALEMIEKWDQFIGEPGSSVFEYARKTGAIARAIGWAPPDIQHLYLEKANASGY